MAADKIARLRNIRHKLEYLGCPFVDNVEESWLLYLLFKPGKPRLRLIQWLLGRIASAYAVPRVLKIYTVRSCVFHYCDKPCLGWRNDYDQEYEWITYNEIHERALCFGSGLLELVEGSSSESYVGIYSPNKVEWVLAEQGCNCFSLVIIPLYDTLGPDACAFIINQAKIKITVCDASKVGTLLKNLENCEHLEYIIKIGKTVTDEEQEVAKKKWCGDFNLSRSRSQPKGAIVTHANMVALVSSIQFILAKCGYAISNDDVHLSYLPLAHMYERACHLMVFSEGARIGFFTGNVRGLTDDLEALSFVVAVIVPELPVLSKTFSGDIADLCEKEEVKQYILNEMTSCGKKANLRSFEQAKALHLHPEPYTVENGFLTPTFKLKLPLLNKLFAEKIQEMYRVLNS